MEHDAYCVIHDCYYDIHNCVPERNTIEALHGEIPLDIKQSAAMRGWLDTEVRERVYDYLEELEKLK